MKLNNVLSNFWSSIKSYLGENFALKSELSKVPIGTISWVMGENVPTGYLICNGQNVSRETYSKLFEILGTRYGEGDGETTFGLPNLIGKFLQGDTTSGTIKEAGLPNIKGSLVSMNSNTSTPYWNTKTGCFYSEGSGQTYYWCTPNFANQDPAFNISFDASRSNSIYGKSSTVQPPSVTSIPCIKAFDTVTNTENLDVGDLLESKLDKNAKAESAKYADSLYVAPYGPTCSITNGGGDVPDSLDSGVCNLSIKTWWSVGFYDSCYNKYSVNIDARAGVVRAYTLRANNSANEGLLLGSYRIWVG